MKKIINIIFINIILVTLLLFTAEIIVWGCENIRIKISGEAHSNKLPIPFHPGVKRINSVNLNEFKNSSNGWIRMPEGLNYKNPPIVIFGCSFAYGFNLKKEQTFSYKLSHLTKRPVYNRAVAGWGFQHMLNQVRQSGFYDDIPEPEYAIYVMISDHFRRMYVPTFMSASMLAEIYNLRYESINNHPVLKTPRNTFEKLIERPYLSQKLEHFYINNFLLRSTNRKEYFNFALEHLVESRNEMRKHWTKTKYAVILYQYFPYDEEFMQMLKNNSFIVISVPHDYKLNMRTPDLEQDNCHPKEKAWDILTPKIAETLKL